MTATLPTIAQSKYPRYVTYATEWLKWRLTYNGGVEFRDHFLKEFSNREDKNEFNARRGMTPIPTHAKAVVNEIRTSIFQRMVDITRSQGSPSYRQAIAGLNGGVDNRGSTMNFFMGVKVLEDLLVMGKIGVYVDNSASVAPTLVGAERARPYLYTYSVEDIHNFSCSNPEHPSEFSSVLLVDRFNGYDDFGFIKDEQVRYRKLWLNKNGKVSLQFYNANGIPIGRDGTPGIGETELELTKIPFVLLDIGDSILKDACEYQIALLNLTSSDINYSLRANFPIFTKQEDLRSVGTHLKKPATHDGSSSSGGQGAADKDIRVGVQQGIIYPEGTERPGFINPSSETLKASMLLQEKLKREIRELVNLAVMQLGVRASAEAKKMDNQGLEAGLSYIGYVLENGERRIAEYYAAYESRAVSRQQIPTIKYPDHYGLKTDNDRVEEATKLKDLSFTVPGHTVKREISKSIADKLFQGKLHPATLEKIHKEIDDAGYVTSDPDVIIRASEAGLCGEKTASVALGFPEDEYLKAREDHAAKAARILEAQTAEREARDPGASGVDDLSMDSEAADDEKEESRDQTFQPDKKRRVRGRGRRPRGQ